MCENVIWKIKIKFSNCEEILHPDWRETLQVRASGRVPVWGRSSVCGSFGVECICIDNVGGIDANFSSAIDWPHRRTHSNRQMGNGAGRAVGVARVCTTHSNMANTNYWFFCKCTRNEANSLIKMKWNDACESQYKLRRPQTTDGCLFRAALANGKHYDMQYTRAIYK